MTFQDIVETLPHIALWAGVLIVAAGLAIGYRQTLALLRFKLGAEKFSQLQMQADTLVSWAQQIGKQLGWTGEHKKQLVTVLLREFALSVGIQVTEEELDHLIEAAVLVMKGVSGGPDGAVEVS